MFLADVFESDYSNYNPLGINKLLFPGGGMPVRVNINSGWQHFLGGSTSDHSNATQLLWQVRHLGGISRDGTKRCWHAKLMVLPPLVAFGAEVFTHDSRMCLFSSSSSAKKSQSAMSTTRTSEMFPS